VSAINLDVIKELIATQDSIGLRTAGRLVEEIEEWRALAVTLVKCAEEGSDYVDLIRAISPMRALLPSTPTSEG
jgi:hypothetical protein